MKRRPLPNFLVLFWTTDYHGGIILTIYLPQYQEELESYTNLKMLYLMMCYLCYIIPLYSHTSITVISFGGNGNITFRNNILRLQKRVLRICTGSHYLAHSDPLFHNLHSLKINDINVLQTAVFMFKLNANLLPTTFDKLFSHNKNIHHYPTRVSHTFHLSNPLSSLASRSIRHHGPDIWNSLPESLKSSPSDQSSVQSSLYVFKNTMKTYLLSKYTS